MLFGDLVKPSKVQEQAKVLERKWLRLRVHMNERRTTSLARVGPTVELVEHFLFACGRTALRVLHAVCTRDLVSARSAFTVRYRRTI